MKTAFAAILLIAAMSPLACAQIVINTPANLSLSFAGSPGPVPQPTTQGVDFTDATSATVNWTATASTSSGGNWLGIMASGSSSSGQSASGTLGEGPGQQMSAGFGVQVTITGLTVGTYTGQIRISDGTTTQSVAVTLMLLPDVSINGNSLFFGTTNSPCQVIAISSYLAGTFNWSATPATTSGGNWLNVFPASGTNAGGFGVAVNATALPPGNYAGTITFSVTANFAFLLNGAANAPLPVPVFLTVAAPTQGIISTAAGALGPGLLNTGSSLGDGGPAACATLNLPYGVATDATNNLYIADFNDNRIREVTTAGAISTVAGSGAAGNSGDGGSALTAQLNHPSAVTVDAAGNIYIADFDNYLIRKITPGGTISTVAGNPAHTGYSGDGGLATSAGLSQPTGVAVDAAGNLYIADTGCCIDVVGSNGILTAFAGGPVAGSGYSGDGGPATSAGLSQPNGVAVDVAGNVYINDVGNVRIRKVDTCGIISTVAGNGSTGTSGDGGPATNAALGQPNGLAVDSSGNIYIATTANNNVREVSGLGNQPAISSCGVVPVYSKSSTIQPGEWVSIYGTNLATTTATWTGNFPISLGGTSVTIDGKSAYLWFVSPTQINLQVPNDSTTGSVAVAVTTANGAFNSTVTLAPIAPSFSLLDSKHVAGIILRSNGTGAYGGGAYDILGPTGNSLGYPTVAAKAGDIVELFAVGLGPTSPAVQPGQPFSGAAATTNTVQLTIGSTTVTPSFAGLSSAGLYQINLTIPAALGTGGQSLTATVGSTLQTQPGVVISLQ